MKANNKAYLGEILSNYLSHYYKDSNSFLSLISNYGHFRKLRVTKSEHRLLSSIFESGKAIEPSNQRDFNKSDDIIDLNKDKVVRSEVLELIFRIMQDYPNLFNKHEIILKGIVIIRMKDFIKLFYSQKSTESINECRFDKKKNLTSVKSHYALDISHRNINLDLIFKDCTFCGGIDISDSNFKSFVIDNCEIGQTNDTSISNEVKSNHYNSVEYSINARRTTFKGILKLSSNKIRKTCDGTIELSNINSKSRIEFTSLIISNISLTSANAKNIELNTCEINGQVNFTDFNCYSININNCYIHNTDYGIDLSQAIIGYFHIYQTYVIGGIDITRCNINNHFGVQNSFITSRCFLSQNYSLDKSSAIEGYNARITEIYIRNGTVLLGSLDLQEITVDNIYLSRSRIVSYAKLPAVDLSLSTVKGNIYFGLTISDFKSLLDDYNAENRYFNFGHKVYLQNNSFDFNSEMYEGLFPEGKDEKKNKFKNETDIKLEDDQLYKVLLEGEKQIYKKTLEWEKQINKELRKGDKQISKKDIIGLEVQNVSKLFEKNLKKYKLNRIDLDYSLFIGGINCSSMTVEKSVYTKSAIFLDGFTYRQTQNSNINNQQLFHTIPSSIDFSNTTIGQDLYLQSLKLKSPNCLSNDTYFQFLPLVEKLILKSTTVTRLHLSFNEKLYENHINNIDKPHPWDVFGLKYDFLVTRRNDSYTRDNIKKSDWFRDDPESYEAIQPYEQMASSFLNRGKFVDSIEMQIKGKRRLAKKNKKPFEMLLFWLINIFVKLGLPSSRAFITLSIIFFFQLIVWIPCFDWSVIPHIIDQMIPLNILDYKPSEELIFKAQSNSITKWILNDTVSLFINIFSYIFFTMFIIGLSRITKKDKL
ncbi:hypothetical protein CLV91_3398 [Maribacter vaceletii]|uniref:Uncharacterized protein n=1 Tax=Maribacter vaceletii TaxID=1206816 RepID=A0A495DT62_9FLAO|nr:hypothetical protein [Maribacter vaceletii]RKR06438.1 hypothetical protein CLV91_3398 [Maribacter vaceletii]